MATSLNKKLLIPATLLVLGVLYVAGTRLYQQQQSSKMEFLAREDVGLFVRPDSPAMGPEDAAVILVEYLDPACEACRAFYPGVKKILELNPRDVRLVVRYAPFHQGSDFVARALEATRLQNLYWESLEALFRHQRMWASHHNPQIDRIWLYMEEVGVDVDKAKGDMDNPEIVARIEQDMRDLKTLGVRRTPTFFVNGKPLKQFGYEQLVAAVQAEI